MNPDHGYIGTCSICGKRCYTSRKLAKRAARSIQGNRGKRMSAYACGQWWHIGHLPDVVRRGKVHRDQIVNHRKATS